jgi:GxxExxY protein
MQEDTKGEKLRYENESFRNEREKPHPIIYDGKPLKQAYRADFVCYGNIIVEIKAVHKLTSELFVNSSVSIRVRPWLF